MPKTDVSPNCIMTLVACGLLLALFFVDARAQQIPGGHSSATIQSALGDVKYSILDPEKFAEQNGKGWVLMEGQDIGDSDLFRLYGIKTLPDARGRFIRGMNLNQQKTIGDADGNRAVGSPQMDAFQGHGHRHEQANNDGLANPKGTFRGFNGNNDYDVTRVLDPISHGHGEVRISTETRPRNITLYVYIKINQ